MSSDIDYVELADDVRDWVNTNCCRSCYKDLKSYVNDIRLTIANKNDEMLYECMGALVYGGYYLDEQAVVSNMEFVAEVLAEECQFMLDNINYDKEDNLGDEYE